MEMQHSSARQRPRLTDCNPYLTCGICHGYLIDAVSNPACLHSFCRSCVLLHLDKTDQFCPVCRRQNSTDTLLTELSADRLLQTIVYKVVPNLYGCEIQRRINFLNEFTGAASTGGDASRRKERRAIRLQRNIYAGADRINLRLVRCESMPFDFIESESFYEDLEEDANQKISGIDKNETCNQKRYLLCPVELTIGHLKKYIRFKFDMNETFEIEVYYADKSLLDEYTLVDVAYIFIREKVVRMTLYYVVFDNSANKAVCLESECNNNSVAKSRNRKRKLELETAQNTGNTSDEETEIDSKKSRNQSHEEILGSNGERREELREGQRLEDNQEEINGSRSHIAFDVDSPTDSRLYESLEPNTDSNDLNCLNAGDASLAVAENSDIIAHITQNSAFSKTTGFYLQENNNVDLDSSKAVGGFLHPHFVEEMAVDRTAGSDLMRQQAEENNIHDLTEQQDLENSVSGQLTPEEIRTASDFYYAHRNAVEMPDYFQEDVNPIENGGVSVEHWLPTATDTVSRSGDTLNETQTEGEMSYPAETDPSKDSDAEIDTEIRRIAANVAISNENSMTDYGMNDDSESALPSPYPEPVENTVGDGETRVVGGHRNIMDSIAISQLFSPSSSSSTSVGISVGNFLVQSAPPFEFLVRSDGMSHTTTLGLNGLSLNGHGFPNWADYVDPMQEVQHSSFRIVPTEPGTFPMLNSNFAAVGLPVPNLAQSVAVSKLLSPGSIPIAGCFPVDNGTQNDSVFPATRDITTVSADESDSSVNGCMPANMLCSPNKPGSIGTASVTSPFDVVSNIAIPEVQSLGLTRNDRDSSTGDIHCIGTILEVDDIHLPRMPTLKLPEAETGSKQLVSTLDQSCAQDEDKPDCLNRSSETSDTNAGIFIDSGDRVDDNNIAGKHVNDSTQLCTCNSGLCISEENITKHSMLVHSVLEPGESVDGLSPSAQKFSVSATNASIGNSAAISSLVLDSSNGSRVSFRTEQHRKILESATPPVASPMSLSSEHSECEIKEDSLSLSGTPAENGEAIIYKDSFACKTTEVDVSQFSKTLISNGHPVSLSSSTSAHTVGGNNTSAVESQGMSNTENTSENNSVPKENHLEHQEGKEGDDTFKLQRKPQNETVNAKETATRPTVRSANPGTEASCENQPGGKISVGTQTNIDLLGRYFKRRVNPVNSFLAGKTSRSNNSSTSRDNRSSKSAKTSVSVATSKSTSSTLSSTVNLSTGGSLTSQAAIFHISGHGAPILFPAVSPVTINGKSTFLITVPGNFSFPSQNGVRPNMTLIPTRLNYSNPRSAAIGLSAPLVLHQGTPTSQAMVIGRAVGPPLQLIVPPAVSTAPVFESSKNPQAPATMVIPGANRQGLVCRFTLNSNQPACAVPTPTAAACISEQAAISIGSITRSVCTDTASSVSHPGMQAASKVDKPGTCIVASCSSVPHLTLSAATLPTFVLSNAPPLTFQNHNVLNGNPNPRTDNAPSKTPIDASTRPSNKSASPISSTVSNITCCSSSSIASSVQSSGLPSSTASVFQKFPGARHIAISSIPHVGNKFSVARKGSDLRVPSGGPQPIHNSTADLIDSQDTSTSSAAPATTATSDIRVSFQFDAKSGNYSLTQGQRIEGAPVSLIRAILERNLTSPYDTDRSAIGSLKISQGSDITLTSPVTKSTNTTSNVKPSNTMSKSKSSDVSDSSRQSPPVISSIKISHNDESVESRNLPDFPKISSPVSSPDKKLDRQDSDEMTEKDALAVRCRLSKTTRPTFFQGNGENASAKPGNISNPLGAMDTCRMKAPRGPPLPSGVVTRSQRAGGSGRVDDVSRGCPVPPAPSLTAMAMPSSANPATSRRRSAAEANIKMTTSTLAKSKRRCSVDTGPKLDNWTVASADPSDPLSPSLAAVFTKQCSIGITRCAVATDANGHTSLFTNPCQAPVIPKALGICSKASMLPETTTATSGCQMAFVTATTTVVSLSVESRCQTVTVSGTENGGKSLGKSEHHSLGHSQAENGSGTANGTSKPGWASMAVQTRCGMVALPKKVYTYLGSAMSHEHIAAREKNIDGQSSGLPCSMSVPSMEEPTNGHARNTGPDSEPKRATSHTATCYLSPNDDDLECQNTAPPINQLRRMCNHFQNGSRVLSSPTAEVELLPPRLSPFS